MHTPHEEPIRVLIVDDDAAVRQAFTRILSSAGCSTEMATDGREALALLTSKLFDVVLADIAIPALDGLALLRAVRERGLDISVILMTGEPQLASAIFAVQEGAFRYLTKPIDAGALVDNVRQAIEARRAARLHRGTEPVSRIHNMQAAARASLEDRFARALAGLEMHFQPIIDPVEHRTFGYEALVRSREPTLAIPDALFQAAERLAELRAVGRAVRAKVAQAAPAAPADALLFVNVRSEELSDDELLSPLAPLSLLAPRVVLEITERRGLDQVSDLGARIARLCRLGYRVGVDRFGSGHASLASLLQLEPNFVKLDRSLVRGVDLSLRKRCVVRAVAALCTRELGVQVVCEGVETLGERDTLVADGIPLLQGFLFARPTSGFATPRA
jgi:EAL domain-containing protein (putative c-di-GMP-specific phosphodiesterase class I)